MKLGIIRLYVGESGKVGYYNIQEIGLAKSLAKKGIYTDIFFIVSKKNNNEVIVKNISDKVRVIYIPSVHIANHGIINPKFILDYHIDIVHLLSDNQIMVPSFNKFCKKNNINIYNYIGTISSDTNNKLKKIFMNTIANRNIKCYKNSKVIVKTPSVAEELKAMGINNLKVIPVGLDLDVIPNLCDDRKKLREKLNIPVDKRILIFVGRLEEYKEPLKAIELIRALNKTSDNYILIMIGQGSLKEKVDKLINNYNLSNIILIDKIENSKIHNYYKASDIFLNFNSKEIFGMSILEAMNQGCKVIAKNAPGPSFIIKDKVNGIIMEDFDTSKWIQKIKSIDENNNISKEAKKRISKCFNWDIISDQYINLFKEIRGYI